MWARAFPPPEPPGPRRASNSATSGFSGFVKMKVSRLNGLTRVVPGVKAEEVTAPLLGKGQGSEGPQSPSATRKSMDEEVDVADVEIVEPLAAAFAMVLSPATPRDNGHRTSPPLMEGDGDAFSL